MERRTAFWRERITQSGGSVFVAEEDDVFGFCDLVPSRNKDVGSEAVAEIAAIYILPEHWRKEAGRMLCNTALAEARRCRYQMITLWVLASNTNARHFYERLGFSLDGAIKIEKTSGEVDLHEVRFRKTI